jgi:hypothetical protein
MAITVDTVNGTVTIQDRVAADGTPITGTENALLQAAIDRAAANTARVSLLQNQLREQNDQIAGINGALTKLLNNPPSNPTANGIALPGIVLSDFERTALQRINGGNIVKDFLDSVSPLDLAANKSFNDLVTEIKSALNQATSQNQQAVINYQSLINQRNQMVEWTANLINLLLTAASQTAANLR